MFDFGRPQVQLSVLARTDVGCKRTQNQDSFLVADLSRPAADGALLMSSHDFQAGTVGHGEIALGPKGALLVVSDGMGGAVAGDLASRLAVECIFEEMATKWAADRNDLPQQFASRLREALEAANTRIHQTAATDAGYQGMGTTTTAVGVLDGFLYLAQVGDSRAYLLRGGHAMRLTRDQSMVQELMDAGQLTPEEAEQSTHRNVILQALGTGPQVAVDLTYQQARRGDIVLICSDGLSGLVKDHELGPTVEAAPDLAAACHTLVELARERGGPDNITAVLARLDGPDLDEPQSDDIVRRRVYELDR